MYENFLHKNFYARLNYSNRAVININHMKIFLHKNFYQEKFLHKKVNYSNCFINVKVYFKNIRVRVRLYPPFPTTHVKGSGMYFCNLFMFRGNHKDKQ